MRKLLQWCLVAGVGIGLLLLVAHQIFSASTGRARDVSVAALKERLGESPVQVGLSAGGTATAAAPVAPESPPPSLDAASPELDALRTRWLEAIRELEAEKERCMFAPAVVAAVRQDVESEDWSLSQEEMNEVHAYQDCLDTIMEEFLFLCGEIAKQPALAYPGFPPDWEPVFEAFPALTRALRDYSEAKTATGQHAAAVAAISARYDLSRCDPYAQPHEQTYIEWIWPALAQALEARTVPGEAWDRIMAQLEHERRPDLFLAVATLDSRETLETWENWDGTLERIKAGNRPLSYAQHWAYRDITTPLFNHDLDLFSRAMLRFLELAELPLYEARPGLAAFYAEFDVEAHPSERKFIRGNSSWVQVLWYSRVWIFEEACRQASVDVTAIAIRLERQRAEQGSYPPSLAALEGSVPVNPLDGLPYHYVPTAEGFELGYYPVRVGASGEPALADTRLVLWGAPSGGEGTATP